MSPPVPYKTHGSITVGFFCWCHMLYPRLLAAVLVLFGFESSARAQIEDPFDTKTPTKFSDVATITAEVVPAQAKRGETVKFRITATPKPGAWVYPLQADQDYKTRLVTPPAGELIFVTPPVDPPGFPWKTKQEMIGTNEYTVTYSPAPVTWEFQAVVSPKATPGKKTIRLDDLSEIPGCNDKGCVITRKDDVPGASFEVLPGDPVPVNEQYRAVVEKALGPATPPPTPGGTNTNTGGNGNGPKPQTPPESSGHGPAKEAKPSEQVQTELEGIRDNLDKSAVVNASAEQGVGAFVLTAVFWGLISLVTPCVFPMIPITVSIFLKQAHGSFRERLKLAGVYCLTIIVVLGLSAFALLKFMAWLSAHPMTNVLLGTLFVVLALSLFGMYELTLPNFMVRRLQAKQSQGGVIGTIFGALAFTVISFTCVAPFLGGFAGISASDTFSDTLIAMPTGKEILGGLAFATAFAAPFFILAMVPGLLKALPKSGGWLDSVKVVMGFLELAAALKFFRTAELRVFSPPAYFTYDLVLAGWVAITLACGLYLLNMYRLPHDEEKPNLGVTRLLFALLFLGLSVYLFPALFKGADGKSQRPAGAVYAWVDAFLLPEPSRDADLHWGSDLFEAIARDRADALKSGQTRPILVDFTGVTCTNCKYNEFQIFTLPKVREQLEKFERVQLYTDEVPAALFATDPGYRERVFEARANRQFKIDAFGTDQLPLYVAMVPKVSDRTVVVLGVYPEGKINEPDQFVVWLKEMQDKVRK